MGVCQCPISWMWTFCLLQWHRTRIAANRKNLHCKNTKLIWMRLYTSSYTDVATDLPSQGNRLICWVVLRSNGWCQSHNWVGSFHPFFPIYLFPSLLCHLSHFLPTQRDCWSETVCCWSDIWTEEGLWMKLRAIYDLLLLYMFGWKSDITCSSICRWIGILKTNSSIFIHREKCTQKIVAVYWIRCWTQCVEPIGPRCCQDLRICLCYWVRILRTSKWRRCKVICFLCLCEKDRKAALYS